MMKYDSIAEHTVRKIESVSNYAEAWAAKLLNYPGTNGIVYIDCMCNYGKYERKADGSIIDGTAIRVAKKLNELNRYTRKDVIVIFNDIENERVEFLEEEIKRLSLNHIRVFCYNKNANELLKLLKTNDFAGYNTLLFYDPYQGQIDWEALEPYFNNWGEVIINHMVSDVTRGAKTVKDPNKKAKYEKTYQRSIDDLIRIGDGDEGREQYEEIIQNLIRNYTHENSEDVYIASFPFFNSNNALVYNLIFFSHNEKGATLFKKVAWQTAGGQSAVKKNTEKNPGGQMEFDLDTGIVRDSTPDGVYTVDDIAKYLYLKLRGKGEMSLDEMYGELVRHPIFPSEGYKPQIKAALKTSYNVKTSRSTITF